MSNYKYNPTILLGVDGATFNILDYLVAEGKMPNVARFMEEGVRAELLSTRHPLTPPAWTTLMTGREPGSHGIFDFIWAERRNQEVYFTLNNFRDIQVETVWSMVSRAGGRATSLNYPLMAPPPEINGVIIPGLVSWKHLRRSVQPRELYDKLKELPGFNPKEVAWDFDREKKATKVLPRDEIKSWVEHHLRRERQWYQIFEYLHTNRPSDLTGILLDGVDKLQHICWRHLDPDFAHTMEDDFDREVQALALQYFMDLDKFFGYVMDVAGDSMRIFVASDHGFGPTEKVFRVNEWLSENGYLHWTNTETLSAEEKQKLEHMANNHFVHLDWDNTIAYAQSSATNGIHIQIKNSPGDPGIEPEEYEGLCQRLTDELLAIRDPETGTQIVTEVMRREEAFPGAKNDRCPDLTLKLFDHGFISTLNKQPVLWDRPEVAGTHQPEGIFLARGPGIKSGESLELQSIGDITPTLLHSLGMPIPSNLEGRVMQTAFEAAYMTENPVREGEPTVQPNSYALQDQKPELDKDEQEAVMDQLRALGYVE